MLRIVSVYGSVYNSVCAFSDPPPAEAILLHEDIVKARIEKYLSEEKYTNVLELVVEKKDKAKLRQAEKLRKDRDYVLPKVTEEVKKGKGTAGKATSKKSKFFNIVWLDLVVSLFGKLIW